MLKRQYLILFVVCIVITCVVGNYADNKVRSWVEVLYELVTGVPMVSDISQCDENGVPYVIEKSIGKQRNPMTVCNKALWYYDNFTKGDSTQRKLFLNCADWLMTDMVKRDSFAVLKYDYDWAYYHMIAPWRSGLANGVSLRVFFRAHKLTNNQVYLDAAKQILNSFYVEVDKGGVIYSSKKEGWWFEEFADEGGVVSRVLNGHMFAVLGIYEYFKYTNDSSAYFLFNEGVLALKNNISKYDRGNGHSFYDLRGTPANVKYHFIHVDLLGQLFEITGDKIFETYRDKWKMYQPPSLMKRLITHPFKPIDVAIWVLTFVMVSVVTWPGVYLFKRITKG